MNTTDLITTYHEDKAGMKLLSEALQDARAVGEGELDEACYPDVAKLWSNLLEVIGAST